jgi:hypothetical protein
MKNKFSLSLIDLHLIFIKSAFNLELIWFDYLQRTKDSYINYKNKRSSIVIINSIIETDRRLNISFNKLITLDETIKHYEKRKEVITG